jgi:hypothetical protein
VRAASSEAKNSYAVRLYEPELAGACERFVRRVWPKDNDQLLVYDGNVPPPPRVLFLKEQEVIGHVATVPVRLSIAGGLRDASWAVGLVVLPEHRNGPVAPMVVKKLNEAVEIGLTLHVEEAALRVFKGMGWQHLGTIPQYVRVLNARAFVRTFARRGAHFLTRRAARLWRALAPVSSPMAALITLVFAGHAATGALRHRRLRGATIASEDVFDASHTELAKRVKGKLGVWVFRDERYLTARYGRRMAAYRMLACRREGQLLGYAIVKMRQFANDPRMGDLRMGTLVDCVFDPDETAVLDALLSSVIALCRRERADVVFCTASLRALGERLRRHGFIAMGGTLNAAFHDRTGALADHPPLNAWHLMRGDSDADANC